MNSNSPLLNIKVISQLTGLLTSILLGLPADAVPGADSFQHNINATNTPHHLPTSAKISTTDHPMVGSGSGAMFGGKGTPIVMWFERFDELVGSNLPTKSEEFTLNQNLNQELERVQAMTKVYSNISTRYRRLAKELRSLPVQANWSGLQEYRDNKASFFEDEAECFNDMIKPRKPAETIEDLRAELAEVNQRASSLKAEGQTLTAMDRELRKNFSVHAPRYSDELYKYVSKKQDMPQK
jgi:hypothetical protein